MPKWKSAALSSRCRTIWLSKRLVFHCLWNGSLRIRARPTLWPGARGIIHTPSHGCRWVVVGTGKLVTLLGSDDDIKHHRRQDRLNRCVQFSQGCILQINRSASTEPASKCATWSGKTDERRQAPIKRALVERAQDSTWPTHYFAQQLPHTKTAWMSLEYHHPTTVTLGYTLGYGLAYKVQ